MEKVESQMLAVLAEVQGSVTSSGKRGLCDCTGIRELTTKQRQLLAADFLHFTCSAVAAASTLIAVTNSQH